jgi:hypothetical protein
MSCVLSRPATATAIASAREHAMQRWRSATIYACRRFRESAPIDDRLRPPIVRASSASPRAPRCARHRGRAHGQAERRRRAGRPNRVRDRAPAVDDPGCRHRLRARSRPHRRAPNARGAAAAAGSARPPPSPATRGRSCSVRRRRHLAALLPPRRPLRSAPGDRCRIDRDDPARIAVTAARELLARGCCTCNGNCDQRGCADR